MLRARLRKSCGQCRPSALRPPSRSLATAAGSSPAPIQPLLAGLPHRERISSAQRTALPDLAVDHLVIGGGLVGLATAYTLAKRFPHKTTYLLERHPALATETSARNSEVIHAGLYYPPSSYKTQLCLRGRELLYDLCERNGIPHRNVQKLVVGGKESGAYLKELERHCNALPSSYTAGASSTEGDGPIPLVAPPVRLLSRDEIQQLEPDLFASPSGSSDADPVQHALLSTRTGIVDSHALVQFLHRQLDEECDNAEVVLDTQVVRVDPTSTSSASTAARAPVGSGGGKRGADKSQDGFIVHSVTGFYEQEQKAKQGKAPTSASEWGPEQVDSILARVLINASGLNAPLVLNSLMLDGQGLGDAAQIASTSAVGGRSSAREGGEEVDGLLPMWYSKGNYASYKGPGVENVRHLIYPVPFMGHAKDGKGQGKHGHQSLGSESS